MPLFDSPQLDKFQDNTLKVSGDFENSIFFGVWKLKKTEICLQPNNDIAIQINAHLDFFIPQ